MQVAKYVVGLGLNIDTASLRQVDKLLQLQEKKMRAYSKRMQAILKSSLSEFVLPELKVKKFTFDNLALQRNAQTSLNQVSRLLELPVKNFSFNQEKLNRQVQTSMQRAANQARIITKTITGNSGGYGVHPVGGHTNVVGHQQAYISQQHAAAMRNNIGMGSKGSMGMAEMGAGAGALGGYLGPAAVGYAGVSGFRKFYQGNKDAVSNLNGITNVVSKTTNTPEQNKKEGKQAFDYLYSESNRLGLNAKDSAEGYAKTLAAGQASGLSLKQSQKMFSNLSEHSAVLHLSTEKNNRLLTALGQMMAKGQVMSEELKSQVGDASPTLPSFFAKAWAEQTKSNLEGAAAQAALMKAMERGQVKSNIALRALELASIDAQPKLALSTSTSQAEANRTANTLSYTMSESSINGVEYGFYRINKTIGTFAKDLTPFAESMAVGFTGILGANADFLMGIRGLVKGIPGSGSEVVKAASSTHAGQIISAFGTFPQIAKTIEGGKWLVNKFSPSPAPVFTPQAYQENADRFKALGSTFSESSDKPIGVFPTQSKESAFNKVAESYKTKTITNNITPSFNSTFNITSTAQDVESLSRDLEPHINNLFRLGNTKLMTEALIGFPERE